jgi:MFS family permease
MAGLSAGRILAQWRGRLLADHLLVSIGGAVGGVGLAVGAAAWNVPWAVAGYAVGGTGLAPVVPTVLAAVGRSARPESRSQAISTVTTISYAGFLCSPPLVGTLAGAIGLSWALGVVALSGVLVVAGGQAVRLLPAESVRRESL